MSLSFPGARMVRTFGTGLTIQAILSVANFLAGLILLRRTSDLQYGYYILASNALLLLTSLQTSFIQPHIVTNLTRMGTDAQRDLVGGLMSANRLWIPALCVAALLVTGALRALHWLDGEQTLLIAVSLLTAAILLGREFLRVTLFAYRRPLEVLRADMAYVVAFVAGVFAATLTAQPAAVAVAAAGVAAFIGRVILRHGLWRHAAWNTGAAREPLRKIGALGGWAITGAGIHWLLIQGYGYLVAGILDIRQVAALAATRLTLAPVFVLSGGVSMLLFPMTSRWVHELGVGAAARRLTLLAAVLAGLALCYMGAMWVARDWIFAVVLRKQFTQRDVLLILWSAVFLVTLCRDQLATLPASRERFRDMTLLTGASALVWLVASYAAIQRMGAPGAIIGILIGELVNVAGIIVMILRETRQSVLASSALDD